MVFSGMENNGGAGSSPTPRRTDPAQDRVDPVPPMQESAPSDGGASSTLPNGEAGSTQPAQA
jgi:hypothetical protein